ncbi:hypothetical protein BZA77DRAFT_353104 [Pyronema omphalodes]|nr:hypothetical protein BZA77DRAFT_353104 [Pyronema omphalodes]
MPSTINALALEFDPSHFYPSPIITDKLTVDNDRLLNGSILSTPLNAPLPYVEEINYSVSFPISEKRTILRPDAELFSPSILKAERKPETNTQLDAGLAQIEKELIQLELRQQEITSNYIPRNYSLHVTNQSSSFPPQVQPVLLNQQNQPYQPPQYPLQYYQHTQPLQFHPALASPFYSPPKPRRIRTHSPIKSRSGFQKYHSYPQYIPKSQPTVPILSPHQQTPQWIFNQQVSSAQPFQLNQTTQQTKAQQSREAYVSEINGVDGRHDHNTNYGHGYIDPFWNQLPRDTMQQGQQQDSWGRWSCDTRCDNEWYLRAQPGLEKNVSPGVSPEASPRTRDCRVRRVGMEDPAVCLVESGRCRWCRVGRCASENMCEKMLWTEKAVEQRCIEQNWMEQMFVGGLVRERDRIMERL